jgi:hypothetical protein
MLRHYDLAQWSREAQSPKSKLHPRTDFLEIPMKVQSKGS